MAGLRFSQVKFFSHRLLGRCTARTQVPYLHYCTTSEIENVNEVEYPDIKPKWPPGIYGVATPKFAWQIYEERCELEKIDDPKLRLEKVSGTLTKLPHQREPEKSFRVLTRPYNLYPRVQRHHQYTTKTKLLHAQLPDYFSKMDVKHIVPEVRTHVLDSVHHILHTKNKCNIRGLDSSTERTPAITRRYIIGSVVNTLMSSLSADNEHLMRSQVDENCRILASWKRIGYNISQLELNRSIRGSLEYGNIARFQLEHCADFQIRSELPLPEFVNRYDGLCYGESIDYIYAPIKMGEGVTDEWATNISGFWINDPCEFTSLSIHCLGDEYEEFQNLFPTAVSEFKTTVAFLSGFGSCVAQAHNQGFNWVMDITYPFTTQTLVFDGENIRVCAYQLNTLNLWQFDRVSQKQNLAWISDEIKLFHYENGQVVGLNDEALELLIKCLLVEPVDRGYDLRPYLLNSESPRVKQKFFNHVGEEVWEEKKIGRWEYPRDSVYFKSAP